MGCNGSKSTKVQVIGPASEGINSNRRSTSKKRGGVLEVIPGDSVEVLHNTDSNPDGVRVLKDKKMGSRDSLGSVLESETRSQDRLVSSATSKISQRTFDSGLESDYGHVITEYSHPNMVEERPPTPELVVSGLKCDSRKSSGRDRSRLRTGQDIIGELKSQGILSTAATAVQQAPKKGGTSFEVIIAIDFDELKKPPARLAKLKRRKKKKIPTKKEVDAKLQAAEERRKKKESRLREKLNTVKKEAQAHKVAEVTEEVHKKQVEEKMTESLNHAAKNREAHFKAQRERLEQKKRHAEKVRQAKLARMAEKVAQGGEGEEGNGDQEKGEDVSAV